MERESGSRKQKAKTILLLLCAADKDELNLNEAKIIIKLSYVVLLPNSLSSLKQNKIFYTELANSTKRNQTSATGHPSELEPISGDSTPPLHPL